MARIVLVLPGGRSPIRRVERTLRAVWRDSTALWREFRVPFLLLIGAIFGGGVLYGEVYAALRGERLPVFNLPLMMIELMTLQGIPEEPLPPEPALIAFYYVIPLIGVYALGRGAVDFVRLFFNRGERRMAWEEAVASTYRNHIIVLGVGHVGLRVIRQLVALRFDVVAIDEKIDPATEDELSSYGVPIILDDGRKTQTLERAGLRHAIALCVCTSNDEANVQVTMRARDMNPNVRLVVRAWDLEFASQLKRFMGVQTVLSSSDLSAPAFAGAAVGIEIAQTITVRGEEYSFIRLQVAPGSFLDGHSVDALQSRHKIDIVLHETNGDVDVHPDGARIVQAEDTVVIFAKHSQIVDIATRNQRRATLPPSSTFAL